MNSAEAVPAESNGITTFPMTGSRAVNSQSVGRSQLPIADSKSEKPWLRGSELEVFYVKSGISIWDSWDRIPWLRYPPFRR